MGRNHEICSIRAQTGGCEGRDRGDEAVDHDRDPAVCSTKKDACKAGDIKSSDLVPGQYTQDVVATKAGFVHSIDNKSIVQIARAAGSPSDKGAGLLIFKKRGQRVEKGDVIMRIHADNEAKGIRAKELALRYAPIHIEGMLIEKG